MRSGIDFTYRLQLHKSLKRLLREVVVAKDKKIQSNYLGRVYTWYFQKLEAMGFMSQSEKDEEEMFSNPNKIEEIQKRKEDRDEQLR